MVFNLVRSEILSFGKGLNLLEDALLSNLEDLEEQDKENP